LPSVRPPHLLKSGLPSLRFSAREANSCLQSVMTDGGDPNASSLRLHLLWVKRGGPVSLNLLEPNSETLAAVRSFAIVATLLFLLTYADFPRWCRSQLAASIGGTVTRNRRFLFDVAERCGAIPRYLLRGVSVRLPLLGILLAH